MPKVLKSCNDSIFFLRKLSSDFQIPDLLSKEQLFKKNAIINRLINLYEDDVKYKNAGLTGEKKEAAF